MPHSLFNRQGDPRESVMRMLRSCRRTILLLDFDGTLAPIRRTPSVATLPPATREILEHLEARPSVTVALVTGRSLSDIVRKVPVQGLILITNHGFQISSGGVHWVHPAAKRAAPLIAGVARKLGHALEPVRNVLIEKKKLTLSVHYRNVREKDVPLVKRLVTVVVRSHEKELKLTAGNKVLEIRPRAAWSKGHAVLRILKSIGQSRSRCVVYVGDDTTDEDAFRLLPSPSVTVRVGRHRASAAAYWVSKPSQVRRFLEIVDSMNSGDMRR